MGQLTLTICSLQANLDNCLLNQYIQRAHRATNLNHFFVFMILWIIKLHFKICVRGRHHSVSPAMFCRFFFLEKLCTSNRMLLCRNAHTHSAVLYMLDRLNRGPRTTASKFIHLRGWQSSFSTFNSSLISFHFTTGSLHRDQ